MAQSPEAKANTPRSLIGYTDLLVATDHFYPETGGRSARRRHKEPLRQFPEGGIGPRRRRQWPQAEPGLKFALGFLGGVQRGFGGSEDLASVNGIDRKRETQHNLYSTKFLEHHNTKSLSDRASGPAESGVTRLQWRGTPMMVKAIIFIEKEPVSEVQKVRRRSLRLDFLFALMRSMRMHA
jgi:hypothetical protein